MIMSPSRLARVDIMQEVLTMVFLKFQRLSLLNEHLISKGRRWEVGESENVTVFDTKYLLIFG